MEKLKKRDLNNLKYYIQESKRLIKDIEIFNNYIKYGYNSPTYGEIMSKKISPDKTLNLAIYNSKIKSIIEKRQKSLEAIIEKLMRIIKKIKDPELRNIVELRAVYGKTWEQIGEEVHLDSSYTRKKYLKYIEE